MARAKCSKRTPLGIVPPLPHILQLTEDRLSTFPEGGLPNVVYHGGLLIRNADLCVFYWGSEWAHDSVLQNIVASINGFMGAFLKGTDITQLAEYSTDKYTIGDGSFNGSYTIDEIVAPLLTDDQLRATLEMWIAEYNIIITDNSLLLVFLPPGVQIQSFGERSPGGFVGYHSDISGTIFYGVITYPSPSPSYDDDFIRLTITASHEVFEAITNPASGGWWDPDRPERGEIGDICVGKIKQDENGYWVQKIWSRIKQHCI